MKLLSAVFAKSGRIHIPNLLHEEDAKRLHEALSSRTPWNLTIIHKDLVYDVTPQQLAEMSEEQIRAMDNEVVEFARKQYEGRYRTLRLSDHGEAFTGPIPEFVALTEFLSGEEFIAFIREITGDGRVAFADSQATCYWPGDFLHPHFDVAGPKNRTHAYVLNLTPSWKVEWGGLLGFIDDDGHLSESYTPKWNALNLLDVRLRHYVSYVAPFASAKRYSVTGWLRMNLA